MYYFKQKKILTVNIDIFSKGVFVKENICVENNQK